MSVLFSFKADIVEDNGALTLELSEDSPALKALPILGKSLPFTEKIPLKQLSFSGLVSLFGGITSSVKSLFSPAIHTGEAPPPPLG